MNNTNTREQSTLWLQAKLFYHVFLHVKLTEFTWKDSDSCKTLQMMPCVRLNAREEAPRFQKQKVRFLKVKCRMSESMMLIC